MDQIDERHLRRAIELAVAARAAGDMPLGSLIVGPQGEVLGRDRSLRTRPGRVAPSARRLQDLEQAGAVAPDPNSATTRDRSARYVSEVAIGLKGRCGAEVAWDQW